MQSVLGVPRRQGTWEPRAEEKMKYHIPGLVWISSSKACTEDDIEDSARWKLRDSASLPLPQQGKEFSQT